MVSSVDLKHRPVSHSRICGGRNNEAFRHLPDPFQFEFRVCDLPLVQACTAQPDPDLRGSAQIWKHRRILGLGGPSKSCADKKPQKSGQSNPNVPYM